MKTTLLVTVILVIASFGHLHLVAVDESKVEDGRVEERIQGDLPFGFAYLFIENEETGNKTRTILRGDLPYGVVHYRTADGKSTAITTLRHDKMHGTAVFFCPKEGNVQRIQNFHEGKLHGVQVSYVNGPLPRFEVWDHGELVDAEDLNEPDEGN